MSVLIIGGTGTLAQALVPLLLECYPDQRIRILSRGEHRQLEMWMNFRGAPIDYLVGDVRDYQRIMKATEGVETVFLFAAMKSVDKAEHDPREAVLTNVNGALNVVDACQRNGVSRVMFTSTDKAVCPINIYGATKLTAEKLIQQGNIGKHNTKFSVCRYGNVAGSQGSILDKFKNEVEIEITDPKMTRFFISKQDAANFVLSSMHMMNGGEVFIPKMKSTDLGMLAEAMGKPYKVIGERPGEKMDECLIAKEEVRFVTDIGDRYVRWPSHDLFPVKRWGLPVNGREDYTSFNAERFTKEELLKICRGQ